MIIGEKRIINIMYMYSKRLKELVLVIFVSKLNIKLNHEWERKQERLGRKEKVLNIGEDRKTIEIYNEIAVARQVPF